MCQCEWSQVHVALLECVSVCAVHVCLSVCSVNYSYYSTCGDDHTHVSISLSCLDSFSCCNCTWASSRVIAPRRAATTSISSLFCFFTSSTVSSREPSLSLERRTSCEGRGTLLQIPLASKRIQVTLSVSMIGCKEGDRVLCLG